jgi:hypothetical protein
MSGQEALYKRIAAEKAVEFVKSGMVVGLGHGSTVIFAVRAIAEKIKDGDLKNIYGICCSREMEKDAGELGVPLTSLDEYPVIDLAIDGADEVDSTLNCIKGGGGALLRENGCPGKQARDYCGGRIQDVTANRDQLASPDRGSSFRLAESYSLFEKIGRRGGYTNKRTGNDCYHRPRQLYPRCSLRAHL